ncbi:MAG: hypothetical protein IJ343_06765 [Clostridia bacterium]|nr:hypothetical protein [Clostridia bacterium]
MKKALLLLLTILIVAGLVLLAVMYANDAMEAGRVRLEVVAAARDDRTLEVLAAQVQGFDNPDSAEWQRYYRGSEALFKAFREDGTGFVCIPVTVCVTSDSEDALNFTDVQVEGAECFVDWGEFVGATTKIMSGFNDYRTLPVILRAEDVPAEMTLTFRVRPRPLWDFAAAPLLFTAE